MWPDKKIDFSQLGFNRYQVADMNIVMSLKTPEEIQDWMMAVGAEDVTYAIGLLEQAALLELDNATDDMEQFPEAMAAIRKIMKWD
jgi:hypothetical protein